MEKLTVTIKRSSRDYRSAEVDIEEIYDVKWDNISGGVYQYQSGYSLYGYISYSLAQDIGIACSGRHDFGRNNAKICIPASLNKGSEGYKHLLKYAGKKPINSSSRPKGCPACTKKILELLKSNEMTRGELRIELHKIGYKTVTIRNALKRLDKTNRIFMEGSPYSSGQKIKLNVNLY